MQDFAKTLQRYMWGKVGAQKLSNLTKIPRSNIDSWLQGRVKRPRDWRPILTIAQTLVLTRDETEALLLSAHQLTLAELAEQIAPEHPDRRYLQPWIGDLPIGFSACHQLRAPIGDFVGRTAEIERLQAALLALGDSGNTTAISGVQGMGGIGKTELAYTVAHRVRNAFPHGQLVLNLRGTSSTPLTPEQALQTIIRAFTPDAKLPDDLPALEVLYRAQLHNKRVLILADDAGDAAQVRPLLPPAGCALLITSRFRFTLPAMTTINLELLQAEQAHTLLRTICPQLTQEEAAGLAQACGYLPLALRMSGSLLHNDPALAVADYLAQLQDERQRLALLQDPDDPALDVAATLALSYAQLDPLSQMVFRLSGAFVTDFGIDLASAVVATLDTADMVKILGSLLRRNLIIYDGTRERWYLHDLVRDLARRYLDQAEETETVGWRYACAVVPIAQQLHEQYLAGGAQASAALARFDAERAHLERAWSWADSHAETLDGAQITLALALATTHLGEIRLNPERERLPLLQRALKAAQSLGRVHDEGTVLLFLGRAAFSVGTIHQAIELWERSRSIFQRLQDRHLEGIVLGNLGTAFAYLGNPQHAIPMYLQALHIFRQLADRRREAHALGNLGAAYVDLEDLQAATHHVEEALAYARTTGDRRFEGMLLCTMGEVARASGAFQHAQHLYEEALVIAREIADHQQEARTLMSQGCASSILKAYTDAVSLFDQALTIFQKLGDRWGIAECSWQYGLALAAQGNRKHALELLHASVAYLTHIGHAQAPERAARLAQLSAEA